MRAGHSGHTQLSFSYPLAGLLGRVAWHLIRSTKAKGQKRYVNFNGRSSHLQPVAIGAPYLRQVRVSEKMWAPMHNGMPRSTFQGARVVFLSFNVNWMEPPEMSLLGVENKKVAPPVTIHRRSRLKVQYLTNVFVRVPMSRCFQPFHFVQGRWNDT